ncbi:MAG TPA: dethiobiotin synthase [Verrucomicrobiae bacterium]|nr:dethiobiotin synthase [Verrucomicrobiae bacterium]
MRPTIVFVTGTDTGVGKTVLTALLTRCLRERGLNVAALKPVCSGGRDDARLLRTASGGVLSLDEINPWHFRAPVAPFLAARRERKRVKLSPVVAHLRSMQKRFEVLLIEGAGGLLSPLGDDFDSRDLMTSLRATPVIVGWNRLGAVNQVLLTLEALPHGMTARARVVLMSPPGPDTSTGTNAGLLAEHFDRKRIFQLPWLDGHLDWARESGNSPVRKTLERLASEF